MEYCNEKSVKSFFHESAIEKHGKQKGKIDYKRMRMKNVFVKIFVDKTANGKLYEMLSNLLGITRLYFITKDKKLLQLILYALDDVLANRLYVTGTASSLERFQDNALLPVADSDNMGEGCVTTTWVQINYPLQLLTRPVKYTNKTERSLYIHLIAAENPQTGCVTYYTPLIGKRPCNSYITCCLSNVPGGISMIPLFAYGKFNGSPVINFYESANFTTPINTTGGASNVTFKIKSQVPAERNTFIKITTNQAVVFPLQIGIQEGCSDYAITVNSIKTNYTTPAGFAVVNRLWNHADEVSITFDIPIKAIDGGKSYPNSFAFQRGPQVLAFDESLNKEIQKLSDIAMNPALLFTVSEKLRPSDWIGHQFYQATITKNNKATATLVPCPDESQSGGVTFVWLPQK